jgi:hypothetical protein
MSIYACTLHTARTLLLSHFSTNVAARLSSASMRTNRDALIAARAARPMRATCRSFMAYVLFASMFVFCVVRACMYVCMYEYCLRAV